MSDQRPTERSVLKLTVGSIGLVIGAGVGIFLIGVIAGATMPPPTNWGEGLAPILPAVVLGLPIGGFIGWRLGVAAGQRLRAKAGKRDGSAAALLVILFTLLLLGWLLMEFFGGW